MNRCLNLPLLRFSAVLVAFSLWSSVQLPSPLAAQTVIRSFPASAQRGVLVVTQPPDILINGKAERLSPAARLRNVGNVPVVPAYLAGQELLVNYERDWQGLVHEVWILSPAEARQQRAGMEPVINFNFSSDADKPKAADLNTPFEQLPKFPKQ